MKPVTRLRKRPLAACLALALAVGLPAIAQTTASGPQRPGLRSDRAALAEGLDPHSSPSGWITFVENCDDSGPGSLRDAVANAGDPARIDLRSLACSTITLDTAIVVGAGTLYIDGPGSDLLTIDGGGSSRLFEAGDGELTLTGVRLANGYAAGDGGCIDSSGAVHLVDSLITGCHAHTGPFQARGGAISARYVGLMRSSVISNVVESDSSFAKGGGFYALYTMTFYSTIDSNEARSSFSRGFGGGLFVVQNGVVDGTAVTRNHATNAGAMSFIASSGTVAIEETTVSGNVADAFIGGIYMRPTASIMNSTIAFNCANQTEVTTGYIAAVGLELYQSVAFLSSTIVANNDLCATSRAPSGSAYDVAVRGAGAVNGDHNLVVASSAPLPADTIRGDPMLAPLADNGGHNETHALLPGSPAIDAGSDFLALPWDGRWHWFARTSGIAPDIGAFESTAAGTVRVASSCADSGAGSLRDLAAAAIAGDTIDLAHLACSRITLTTGAIILHASEARIVGPGSNLLTIDGDARDRIIDHDGSGRLELEGLAFENGYTNEVSAGGGGCVRSFGFVDATDTTFSACRARVSSDACAGGAIHAGGAALHATRITGNRCTSDDDASNGGGIAVDYELAIDNSTLTNNVAAALGATVSLGGGFFANTRADVRFSTIAGNSASIDGAGHTPILDVSASTISGNTASAQGGALSAITARIDNSTIAFNAGPNADFAAGLFVIGRADLQSSILFGNTSAGNAYDIGTYAGGPLLGSDNLVGASPSTLPPGTLRSDPLLGPLQDNGGATPTHALGENSPALDAGNNVAGFSTDQRGPGFIRVFNGRADIGAIEMQPEGVDILFANGFDPAG
ncbi:MAG: choice-of-anchor Q domain-containing protein [Rhodanobacteraceae bacterium]